MFRASSLRKPHRNSNSNSSNNVGWFIGNLALLRAMDRIAANAAERAQTPFNQIILPPPMWIRIRSSD
jgi:hypothetical protein